MKKRALINAIISNSVLVLLALVMFVSATVAWFSIAYNSRTEHQVFIGKFVVDINNNSESTDVFEDALDVDLKKMYPMTAAEAYTDTQNHIYRFQIINTGSVSAMFRFLVNASDDAAAVPLSRQLKYSIRFATELEEILSFDPYTWIFEDQYVYDDLLDDDLGEKDANYSLQEFFDLMLVTPGDPGDPSAEPPIPPTMDTAGYYGEVRTLSEYPDYPYQYFYDICFWLSDRATLQSAASKTCTITFNAYFMQSIGGAAWPLDWKTSLVTP